MKLKKPTLVVLDLDDTLYPYESAHSTAMRALIESGARETGCSAEDFFQAF